MKLSNFTAKLTWVKHNAVKAIAAATLAGAVLAAAPAAQAQRVVIGAHFGPPVYGGPAPRFNGPAPYGPRFEDRRFYDVRAHDEWVRHQEWERYHHDHFYGYGPRY